MITNDCLTLNMEKKTPNTLMVSVELLLKQQLFVFAFFVNVS